ncbi:MAG: hypothetical protein K9L68_12225 [Spirochaetales bacterium]|nr:hypothetical protein [Spirochaetales bacterium]MCF7939358.1 hypothetical protein [Spirochaetales bacterium]
MNNYTSLKIFLVVMLFLLPLFAIGAQSNDLIDELLEEKEAQFGKVVYLTMVASGQLEENAGEEDALSALEATGWNLPSKAVESPITLGEASYLYMKALDIPGGLFYSLFPGPRYAYRELLYLDLIPRRSGPGVTVSGEEAVGLLSRALAWKETQS